MVKGFEPSEKEIKEKKKLIALKKKEQDKAETTEYLYICAISYSIVIVCAICDHFPFSLFDNSDL